MSELSPKEGAQKEWSTEWISLRKLCVIAVPEGADENYSEQAANPGVPYGKVVPKTFHADSVNEHKMARSFTRMLSWLLRSESTFPAKNLWGLLSKRWTVF